MIVHIITPQLTYKALRVALYHAKVEVAITSTLPATNNFLVTNLTTYHEREFFQVSSFGC